MPRGWCDDGKVWYSFPFLINLSVYSREVLFRRCFECGFGGSLLISYWVVSNFMLFWKLFIELRDNRYWA